MKRDYCVSLPSSPSDNIALSRGELLPSYPETHVLSHILHSEQGLVYTQDATGLSHWHWRRSLEHFNDGGHLFPLEIGSFTYGSLHLKQIWEHWLKDKSTQKWKFSHYVLTLSADCKSVLYSAKHFWSIKAKQHCSMLLNNWCGQKKVFPYTRSKLGKPVVYMLVLSQKFTVAIKLHWLAYLIIFTACRGFK